MPTEQQIRDLAYAIWEKEGHPEGKDREHYHRARQMLEDQEKASIVKLPPPAPIPRLAAPASTLRLKAGRGKASARKRGRKAS
jgi:hypothetical protein